MGPLLRVQHGRRDILLLPKFSWYVMASDGDLSSRRWK